jgi:hypothetical protein
MEKRVKEIICDNANKDRESINDVRVWLFEFKQDHRIN